MRVRMYPLLLAAAWLGSLLLLPACKHNPVVPELTDPGDTLIVEDTMGCDPSIVYFQQQILPLFISNCAVSGCHDAIKHEEGIILDSYANIIKEIKPFDPNAGDIYEVITEKKDKKVMPPPPRSRLTAEQIALIKNWIEQGAKNLSCADNACDSVNVSFSQHIQPLVNSACKGCHSGTNPSGGINLSSYDAIKSVALSGKMYNAVSGQGPIAMPPNPSPRLSVCQVAKIKTWVSAGAPNN